MKSQPQPTSEPDFWQTHRRSAPESTTGQPHFGKCDLTVQYAGEEYFVDATEAARFLHCSRKHLLKLSSLGKIPAHPLPGSAKRRTWRYLLSELRTWMLNNGTLTNGVPSHEDGRTISNGSPRKGGR